MRKSKRGHTGPTCTYTHPHHHTLTSMVQLRGCAHALHTPEGSSSPEPNPGWLPSPAAKSPPSLDSSALLGPLPLLHPALDILASLGRGAQQT